MAAICVCLFLYVQLRSSSVSVVFDFNDSLNDVAPAVLILFSVGSYIQVRDINCEKTKTCD